VVDKVKCVEGVYSWQIIAHNKYIIVF